MSLASIHYALHMQKLAKRRRRNRNRLIDQLERKIHKQLRLWT